MRIAAHVFLTYALVLLLAVLWRMLPFGRAVPDIVALSAVYLGLTARDRVVPASYAKRFADGLGGLVQVRSVEAAGHMAELDAPASVADAVLSFLD